MTSERKAYDALEAVKLRYAKSANLFAENTSKLLDIFVIAPTYSP